MELEIQINSKAINDKSRALAGGKIIITPPIDEDFWVLRVPVSDKQAIVGFPKFMQIGIGFQHEAEDWNTNLPSSCSVEQIYNHIRRNKGDDNIPDERCIEAIVLIQEHVKLVTI